MAAGDPVGDFAPVVIHREDATRERALGIIEMALIEAQKQLAGAGVLGRLLRVIKLLRKPFSHQDA